MSDDSNSREAGVDGVRADDGGDSSRTVSVLLEERRRFEGWLVALEARRATTPAHVYTRVHDDYSRRLAGVVDQLSAHADGLRAELDALGGRLHALDAEQQQARDERAEGELRAHVGELTPEAWEEMEMASDIQLEELSTRRAALERELGSARELLSGAERPAANAEGGSTDTLAPVGEPEVATSGPARDEDEASPHVPATVDAPDLFAPTALDAVTAPMEVSAAVIAAEQQLIDSEASGGNTLGMLGVLVNTPAGPMDRPPADEPDEATRRDSFSMRAHDDGIVNLSDESSTGLDGSAPSLGRGSEAPLAEHVSGNRPIVLRSKSAEASKTLKCSECASMNYPTEWYCERCGAELASL